MDGTEGQNSLNESNGTVQDLQEEDTERNKQGQKETGERGDTKQKKVAWKKLVRNKMKGQK